MSNAHGYKIHIVVYYSDNYYSDFSIQKKKKKYQKNNFKINVKRKLYKIKL